MKKSFILFSIFIFCLPVLGSQALPGNASIGRVNLGINFFMAADWDFGYIFADVVKNGRYWSNPWPNHAKLDAKGWPTTDADIILIITDTPSFYGSAGTYKLSFESNNPGVIISALSQNPAGSVTITNQKYNAGMITADVTMSAAARVLHLGFSNAGNGIRNVKCMRPGHSPDEVFARKMLETIGIFGTLRPMQLVGEPNSGIVKWSDRRNATEPVQSNYGLRVEETGGPHGQVSYEYLVMLANLTHKDLWLCLPRLADDEYIKKLALLCKYGSDGINPYTSVQANPVFPPLDANLNLYVEFSNEIWNYSLNEEDALATKEYNAGDNNHYNYDKNANHWYWAHERVAWKTMQISNIFRAVFGDAQMPYTGNSRIRPVFAAQIDNYVTFDMPLRYLNAVYGPANIYGNVPHPLGYYLYALSGAPYSTLMPGYLDKDGLTVDQIFSGLYEYCRGAGGDGSGYNLWKAIDYMKVQADLYGLKLVAYEGSQSLWKNGNSEAAKLAAQKDPRMKQFTKDLLNKWFSVTDGVFCYFTLGNASDYFSIGQGYFDNNTQCWQALKELSAVK